MRAGELNNSGCVVCGWFSPLGFGVLLGGVEGFAFPFQRLLGDGRRFCSA